MKTLIAAILSVSLLFCPIVFTGCNTTPTKEAVVYYTLKDTWTAAHQSYKAWTKLVVQGKVTKTKEQQVDRAWNDFRASYKLAVATARLGQDSPASEQIIQLQKEFTALVNQLSKP